MTYDVTNLHGTWESLDDDDILTLYANGNFRGTPESDSSSSGDQLIDVVGDVRGKWKINDGELKISVDLRSIRFSSSSRSMRLGIKVFSFLFLRFLGERDFINAKIICLTATDLWLENSQGRVDKFRKKLR